MYTLLPTAKGQITIPSSVRKKYNISQDTPLILKESKNGSLSLSVARLVSNNPAVEYYESENSFGLHFEKGIDPQFIIDEIEKIDG